MNRVIRNGQVAVLITPSFGAGWSTWIDKPEILFDPEIVAMVENEQHERIIPYCEYAYGQDGYYDAARDLIVKWVDLGAEFIIEEYDGRETVRLKQDYNWLVA
jgi:hypothetical protein